MLDLVCWHLAEGKCSGPNIRHVAPRQHFRQLVDDDALLNRDRVAAVQVDRPVVAVVIASRLAEELGWRFKRANRYTEIVAADRFKLGKCQLFQLADVPTNDT